MNRRKLIGVLASVVVAGLGTMILLKSANSGGSSTSAEVAAEPMVNVLKVVKPVAKGTPADLLGDAVVVQQVRESEKLNDTADNLAQIAGLVANTDLIPNEQIVISRFVAKDVQKKEEQVSSGGAGLIGVWVSLDPIRAIAAQNGKISVGSRVAVYANVSGLESVQPNPGEPSQTNSSTHLILHKVPILDCIGCFDPAFAAPAASGSPAGGAAAAPVAPVAGTPVHVKLGVDAPASERLVFAAKYAEIWIADEDSDVIEDKTKVVDRSNIYLKTDELRPKAATLETGAGSGATPNPAAAAAARPAAATAPTVAPRPVVATPSASANPAAAPSIPPAAPAADAS